MLYIIKSSDHNNSFTLRQKHRPRHLARLQKLKEQGRLVLAGPIPTIDTEDTITEYQGSLIVAEFDDIQQAQEFANSDPFMIERVYKESVVLPFRMALP